MNVDFSKFWQDKYERQIKEFIKQCQSNGQNPSQVMNSLIHNQITWKDVEAQLLGKLLTEDRKD